MLTPAEVSDASSKITVETYQRFATSLSTEKSPLYNWTFAWKQIGRRHKNYFGNRRAQSSGNGKVEKQDATRFGRVGLKKENSSECMLSVPKIVYLFTDLIAVKFEVTLY